MLKDLLNLEKKLLMIIILNAKVKKFNAGVELKIAKEDLISLINYEKFAKNI